MGQPLATHMELVAGHSNNQPAPGPAPREISIRVNPDAPARYRGADKNDPEVGIYELQGVLFHGTPTEMRAMFGDGLVVVNDVDSGLHDSRRDDARIIRPVDWRGIQ
jgi:hypothetical protein